ncbi:MAG: amidohydrolase family protein [Chthonomonadales bacterium]
MSATLIHNGTLIDGTGAEPIPNAGILIQDGKIQSVGPMGKVKDVAPDVTQINAHGGFILPGFIDCHVHFMLEGLNLQRDMMTPFSTRFYNSVNYMRKTLDAGITSARDAGGADAGIKHAVDTGVVAGPRIQISISVLSITGGHVDFWMRSGNEFHILPEYPGNPNGICDGVDGVRKKVREVLRAGADIIKICATGGVMSPTDHPDFTQFSPEELDVIVREAGYRNGVKVMAHAQGLEGIKNAVRAGVHSIEHGIHLDNEAIDMMVERGTFLVPTLLAAKSVVEIGTAGGQSEVAVRKAETVFEAHRESILKAHKAGVKIAMGTDAGVFPHGTNLRELGLMVGIGMTPMESIVASTKTAAECLGWQDRVGTLEAGKLADIVITKNNPLTDIEGLIDHSNIQFVIKGGEAVKSPA